MLLLLGFLLVCFSLQTFVFPRKSDEKDAKTFVRYVEEEGPAYMAGLREGKHLSFTLSFLIFLLENAPQLLIYKRTPKRNAKSSYIYNRNDAIDKIFRKSTTTFDLLKQRCQTQTQSGPKVSSEVISWARINVY